MRIIRVAVDELAQPWFLEVARPRSGVPGYVETNPFKFEGIKIAAKILC